MKGGKIPVYGQQLVSSCSVVKQIVQMKSALHLVSHGKPLDLLYKYHDAQMMYKDFENKKDLYWVFLLLLFNSAFQEQQASEHKHSESFCSPPGRRCSVHSLCKADTVHGQVSN